MASNWKIQKYPNKCHPKKMHFLIMFSPFPWIFFRRQHPEIPIFLGFKISFSLWQWLISIWKSRKQTSNFFFWSNLRNVNGVPAAQKFRAFPEAIERGYDSAGEELVQNLKQNNHHLFLFSWANFGWSRSKTDEMFHEWRRRAAIWSLDGGGIRKVFCATQNCKVGKNNR